jgi:hypothetical protein
LGEARKPMLVIASAKTHTTAKMHPAEKNRLDIVRPYLDLMRNRGGGHSVWILTATGSPSVTDKAAAALRESCIESRNSGERQLNRHHESGRWP